ncbi:hypothetical protein U91I_03802 [alpha proteobacterium U9-1i]|nr:hypothetical protein U91I_03802 [alpha proteobacterium U9-1i]
MILSAPTFLQPFAGTGFSPPTYAKSGESNALSEMDAKRGS